MSAIETNAIDDPVVVRRRDDRLDLGDRRGRRHRDRHDVVDEQRRGGDEPEDRREVGPGHDVRAAAVRVGPADLPVRHRHDGQQDGDRDRHLDRQQHRRRAAEDQDPQDLLGRVGRRRDRVRAEDGERLLLVEALVDLGLAGERTPEDDRRARRANARPVRVRGIEAASRATELARPGVAEVRGVRSLDPDAPVAGLAAGSGRRPPIIAGPLDQSRRRPRVMACATACHRRGRPSESPTSRSRSRTAQGSSLGARSRRERARYWRGCR